MEILRIALSVGTLVLYSHPNEPILGWFYIFFDMQPLYTTVLTFNTSINVIINTVELGFLF